MTEPYDKASAGQPITALRWNNLQTAIRDEIEALKATKLDLAGGTMTGTLEVSRPTAQGVPDDLVRVRSGAGNVGLRVETGGAPGDVAALRFYHGASMSGQLAVSAAGRLSISDSLHLLGGRLGVGVQTPQQALHVAGRVMVDAGVIQRGGPPIADTEDLGLYSQVDGNWVRIVTRNAPVRFFSDAGIGTTINLDVLPSGDLKVRRFALAAGLGVGIDTPQDAVHIAAPTGNLGVRLQNGGGPNDVNAIRFIHGNTERAFIATHAATSRFTVSNTLNVWPGGKVGIATADLPVTATLDVRGDLAVLNPATRNGLLVNTAHTGFSNAARDRGEISLDPAYKTMMIVGSLSAAQDDPAMAWPAGGRRVSVWDRLEINGHTLTQSLTVNTPPTQKPVQAVHVAGGMYLEGGIIQRGGPPLGGTADLGLYSQYPNQWIRLVSNNAPIRFFGDGGTGSVPNLDVLPNGDINVRRHALAARVGAGVGDPQDLLHVKSGGGGFGLRIDAAGAAPTDQALVRFFNADVPTGHIAAVAGGRLTISNTLHVHLNHNRVGVGTGVDVPAEALHVRGATSVGARLEAGGNASDTATLRFVHVGAERGTLTSGGTNIGLSLASSAPNQTQRYLTNAGSHIFYGDPAGTVPNFIVDKDGNSFVRNALRTEGVADLGAVHVRAGTFKVLGDVNSFYPVFFADRGWADGPCTIELTRANIHTDVASWGSLNATFTFHTTNWGHGADFDEVRVLQFNVEGRKRFIARYGRVFRNTEFVVWLRGNTTYSWRSNHRAELTLNPGAQVVRETETFAVLSAIDPALDQDRYVLGPNVDRNLFRGAVVPAIGNSEFAGIQFPRDPGGGTGDMAFIRYHVEANETTTLRIGVDNDPDDSLRLWQAGADRLFVQDGRVSIGNAAYPGPSARFLNVEGEMKSFGAGGGYRMSDRAAPANDARDWVLFVNDQALRFWNGTNGETTSIDKDGWYVGRQMYLEHGVIQRGGAKMALTQDLGLYSQYAGHWMRFVTNNGPIKFFGDSGAGSSQNVSFEPNGAAWFRGRTTVLGGLNPINFTSVWEGTPDNTTNVAEISNDTTGYKTLMIIGNRSAGLGPSIGRRVSIWDRLEVNGAAFVNGAVVLASDRRLKRDVAPLRSALARALELRPVEFTWTTTGKPDIGLIAQEVEPLFPELVSTESGGPLGEAPQPVKALQYSGIAVVAVAAVQELKREVDALRRELAELRERLA